MSCYFLYLVDTLHTPLHRVWVDDILVDSKKIDDSTYRNVLITTVPNQATLSRRYEVGQAYVHPVPSPISWVADAYAHAVRATEQLEELLYAYQDRKGGTNKTKTLLSMSRKVKSSLWQRLLSDLHLYGMYPGPGTEA